MMYSTSTSMTLTITVLVSICVYVVVYLSAVHTDLFLALSELIILTASRCLHGKLTDIQTQLTS